MKKTAGKATHTARLVPGARQVIKELESRRAELQAHGVQRIGVFGSVAKGTQHARSDVDVLVRFRRPSFDSYMDVKFLLEELLGRKVDLVTERALKPGLSFVRKEAVYAQGF